MTGGSSCRSTLAVPQRRIEWTALGNPFLLEAPLLASVRISTMAPPDVVGGDVRAHYGKARFERLNLAARAMGDIAMGISRNQLKNGDANHGKRKADG